MTTNTLESAKTQPIAKRKLIRVERIVTIVDRFAAWFSALLLLLFFVSGFGMTKPMLVSNWTGGLITWRVAYDLHDLLIYPLLATFAIHTVIGIRRATIRTTRRKVLATSLALILGAIVVGFLLNLAISPEMF